MGSIFQVRPAWWITDLSQLYMRLVGLDFHQKSLGISSWSIIYWPANIWSNFKTKKKDQDLFSKTSDACWSWVICLRSIPCNKIGLMQDVDHEFVCWLHDGWRVDIAIGPLCGSTKKKLRTYLILPWNLTWNLQIIPPLWKGIVIFQSFIFGVPCSIIFVFAGVRFLF